MSLPCFLCRALFFKTNINAQMADFVVATGTALKKKNILNKNCAGNVLPSGPAKKSKPEKVDGAPYVGTLVQEHAALS